MSSPGETNWPKVGALAGVAGAMIAFLAYFAPSGAHSKTNPAPSPTVSVAPSTYTFSPTPTPPVTTPPGPTQNPAPALVPGDFDNVATDPTDVSIASMLPPQYTESGVVFNRTSASMEQCPPVSTNAAAGVNDTLGNYGCTGEVAGTYLDSSQQIQVTVWVIPLPDTGDANGAYSTLTASGAVNNWGIWCPTSGPGSQICQGEPWQYATQEVWIGACHRYLMRALALYVDLTPFGDQSTLTSAASSAVGGIGAQNIPVANCWPSSSGN